MELRKARKLADSLMDEWELTPRWTFDFDNAKRRFGCCKMGSKEITLSRKLVQLNDRDQVQDTILHEIAHALDYEERGTSDHSWRWKGWARKVGANPERCYDGGKVNGVSHKWYDYCPNCGRKRGRHRRNLKSKIKSCGDCHPKVFDFNYLLVPNIPAEAMERIENGELDWARLKQARIVVKELRAFYAKSQYEGTIFYEEYVKGRQTTRIAAQEPEPEPKSKDNTAKKKKTATQRCKEIVRPYLERGTHSQGVLKDMLTEAGIKKTTAGNFLSYAKNPKYKKFDRLVVENDEGKLQFEQE